MILLSIAELATLHQQINNYLFSAVASVLYWKSSFWLVFDAEIKKQ